MVYYCAGVRKKGKETGKQFRRRNGILITCKRVPL